jgi:iron complex outermembrane recepter protein
MFQIIRFLLLIVFTTGLLQVQAQCTLTLSGHVNDAETKAHLSDAVIIINELKLSQTTDKDGFFSFKGLCPGTYTLEVSHSGCITAEKHIHLKADLETDIDLSHAIQELSEVIVQGRSSGSTISSNEIKGKVLEATRGLSLAESVKRISGVSVLQTGSNIYKPVIHGLHSSRVLILNNGVRQEAQQWGSEHAPEIDPFIANRISVIKGASAIRYGGDAIAGVILVEPKLLRNDPGIGGEVNTSLFSNNRMGALSAMFEGNSAKKPAFSWRLQGTVKRGGYARTPNYWLANSANEEYNFSVTAGWKKQDRGTELFYSQFNTKLGIFAGSHIGNVTDLWNAILAKDPPDYIKNVDFSYKIDRPYQEIQHQLLKLKSWKNTGETGRLNLIISGQYNNRMEYDQKRFASSSDVPQLDLTIGTGLAELVWDHFNTGDFRGTIGGSFMYQNNSYVRRLFIPNYESTNAGIFIIEKWVKNKLNLEAGLRFDRKSIFNTTDNGAGNIYSDRLFNNLSGNIGFNYRFTSSLRLLFNASSAWRAPQVNELYADGLHHGAARIEKGNSGLSPERANNLAANLVFSNSKWDIDAGVYYKLIDGFIFLEPTFPPELTIRGAFPGFRYSQTDARLSGLDLSAAYRFDAHFDVSLKASVLRAWDKQKEQWLIQMPSDRYEASVEYNFGNARKVNETYLSISSTWVLEQTRVPSTGNIEVPGTAVKQSDYLNPPQAYFLLAFEAGTKLKMKHSNWSFILSVTNAMNKAYRDYMNSFRYFSDEMGRNISLRVRIPFDLKHKHKS